jgi:hypothetical protein
MTADDIVIAIVSALRYSAIAVIAMKSFRLRIVLLFPYWSKESFLRIQ